MSSDWSDFVRDNPDRVTDQTTRSDEREGDTKRSASMRAVARGQTERGRMNQTEARWARILDASEHVAEWWYEERKFRYGADNAWHTPDFVVLRSDGRMEVHEVKAFCTDAGRTRFKAAAGRAWEYRWIMVEQRSKTSPWTVKYDTTGEDGHPFIIDTDHA